jgi:hypothetical protein
MSLVDSYGLGNQLTHSSREVAAWMSDHEEEFDEAFLEEDDGEGDYEEDDDLDKYGDCFKEGREKV